MYCLNHRLSKDIDIFFNDRQYLNFFLPSLNDYLEDISIDYHFLSNFIKIGIGEQQELDFIIAKNITRIEPTTEIIDGHSIRMDSPCEIIAKKIFYRYENFTVRDVFDLATVYNFESQKLISSLSVVNKDIFVSLLKRIQDMNQNTRIKQQLDNIARLPGSKAIEGREFALSIEFTNIMCSRDPEHSDSDIENIEHRPDIRP